MNPYTLRRLEEINQKRYAFDFSQTFNRALDCFKKIFLPAGLAFLVICMIIGTAIMYFVLSRVDMKDPEAVQKSMDVAQFGTLQTLVYVLVMTVITGLSMPMGAGVLKMCRQVETEEYFGFSTAFEYFSGPHFSDLFLSGVMISLVTVSLNVLLEQAGITLLGPVISAVFGLFVILTAPLIIFGDLAPLQAIKASIMVVSKEPLLIFLLLIVSYIIACCGLLVFCVGMFFTMPLIYCVHYAVYANSVGFETAEVDAPKSEL